MDEVITQKQARDIGAKYFFDAIPCRAGHIAKKRTRTGECLECARVRAREYYQRNRDDVRGRVAARYATDPAYAAAAKERAARRRAKLGDQTKAIGAAYYAANREQLKARARAWSAQNRQRKNAVNRAWNKANPDKARQHQRTHEKRRRERDPVYAMGERIGSAIRQSLIKGGYTKRNRVADILGCSYAEFAAHLERQFLRGMSWANRDQWHIDHIIPISSAASEEDIIRLNHFTNLRPLWALDNASKADRRELLL